MCIRDSKQVQNKTTYQKIQMLGEINIDIARDYGEAFAHGTWIKRPLVERYLTDEELEKLPVKPETNLVLRHNTTSFTFSGFRKHSDRTGWIFDPNSVF